MAFDHVVHVKEPKTGRMVKEDHYKLIIDSEGARYERPIGSGFFYRPDGTLLKKPEEKKPEVVVEAQQGKADQKKL